MAYIPLGGHVRPDPYNVPSTLLERNGPDTAAEFAQFEADHIPVLEKVIADEGIDCDFVVTRGIDVFLTCDLYIQMREKIQRLRDHHVSAAEAIVCVEYDEAEEVLVQPINAWYSQCYAILAAHVIISSRALRVRRAVSRSPQAICRRTSS